MPVLQQRSGAALETFLWIAAELDEELDCQKCITLLFSEVLAAVEQYGSSDMPDDFVLCRQLRLEQTLNNVVRIISRLTTAMKHYIANNIFCCTHCLQMDCNCF